LLVASLSAQQYFVDETASRLPYIIAKSYDSELGDLDGDASLDLAVAVGNVGITKYSYVLLNDGLGMFNGDSIRFFDYDIAVSDIGGVALGDIERDNDCDIVLVNAYYEMGAMHHLFVNDGSANYVERSDEQFPIHAIDGGRDAHFIDIDSDLDLDCAIYEWNGGANKLWLNNGSGYFSDVSGRFPSGHDDTNDGGWFDVDRDFDLDCLIVNGNGDLNKLMINDGTGRFTEEGAWRLPEDRTMSNDIEYFDVDNDEDLDAYIATGFTSGDDKMLINDGSGYFTDESAERIPQYSDHSLGVCIGDIDNDGDLDIFVANSSVAGTHSPRIYVSDGTGHFSDETDSRYPTIDEESRYGTFGDVDGDGDLDLYVVNQGFEDGEQNRLLINVSTPDSFPPVISRTLIHEDTANTVGPYILMTEVWDNVSRNIGELSVILHYRVDEGEFSELPMYHCGGHIYRQRIGGFRPGSRVRYYTEAIDRMGNASRDPSNAPDSVYSFKIIGVGLQDDDPGIRPPKGFSLSQNYPNPFNPMTLISFTIPEGNGTEVSLQIYDLHGKQVKKLVDEAKLPGEYSVI
jgi:hypothetical protein